MGLGLGLCCCGCTLSSDDFEREEVGDNWDIESGDWVIGDVDPLMPYLGHTLQLNSDGTEGKITFNGLNLSGRSSLYVSFSVKFTGTPDNATNEWWTAFPNGIRWRLNLWGDLFVQWEITQILCQAGGSDYCYWRIALFDGETEIGRYDLQQQASISQFNQQTCSLCVYEEEDATVVTAGLGSTRFYLGEIEIPEDEEQFLSLSAELPEDKWIWFDDLSIKEPNITVDGETCPTCMKRCTVCKYDRMPKWLKVSISGVEAGDWPNNENNTTGCRWCDCFQNEIYLGYNAASWLDNGASPSCTYRAYINTWCYPNKAVRAYFSFDEQDQHYKVWLNFNNQYYWVLDLGEEKPDCSTIAGTMTFHGTPPEQNFCDFTNATVTIEAVEEAPDAPQYCPPCDDCGLDFPGTITVEITGLEDGTCDTCHTVNGTYVLNYTGWQWTNTLTPTGEGGVCSYRYNFAGSGICGYPYVEVRFTVNAARTVSTVTFEIPGGGIYHYYETGINAVWDNVTYPISRPTTFDSNNAELGHLFGQYDLRGIQRNYCQTEFISSHWITKGHVTITMGA